VDLFSGLFVGSFLRLGSVNENLYSVPYALKFDCSLVSGMDYYNDCGV